MNKCLQCETENEIDRIIPGGGKVNIIDSLFINMVASEKTGVSQSTVIVKVTRRKCDEGKWEMENKKVDGTNPGGSFVYGGGDGGDDADRSGAGTADYRDDYAAV